MIFNEICQGSSIHILNEHEQRIPIVVGKLISYDVRGIAVFHHSNFFPNSIKSLFIFLFHYSYSIESTW